MDQLTLAESLRDEGMARAAAVAIDAGWWDRAWAAIVDLASGDCDFTGEHLRALVGEAPSSGAAGALFSQAVRKGLIRRVGFTPSDKVSVHRHMVSVWRGR